MDEYSTQLGVRLSFGKTSKFRGGGGEPHKPPSTRHWLTSIDFTNPYLMHANTFFKLSSVGFSRTSKRSMVHRKEKKTDLAKHNLAFRENSDTLYGARKHNLFVLIYTLPKLNLFCKITLIVFKNKWRSTAAWDKQCQGKSRPCTGLGRPLGLLKVEPAWFLENRYMKVVMSEILTGRLYPCPPYSFLLETEWNPGP
jgi:hypothetical protein